MTASAKILEDIVQGSDEWLALRKTKVTATDANSIMGANPWKTKLQLYYEKLSDEPPMPPNERMQRGIDLEPIARDLFNMKTRLTMKPVVLVKDWVMASLDGMNEVGTKIIEIKCPGEKDHATALSGRVPDHYYPQLQHQIYVAGVSFAYYFSFDGADGVIVEVQKDEEYIKKMIIEEKRFYDCLMNKIPPETEENDYVERNDPIWSRYALQWRLIQQAKKDLEEEEEQLRRQLIFLSGECATKGGGVSLCSYQRKGNVDYTKIPVLKNLDLEQFRKPTTTSWRITCH